MAWGPHVSEREGRVKPGSGLTHAGQRVSGRRRLAAGEDRRGGVLRDSPTGRHLLRGGQLRAAGDRPHPAMVVAWPGSGRSFAGDEAKRRLKLGQLVRGAAVA